MNTNLLLKHVLLLMIMSLVFACMPEDETFSTDSSIRLTFSTDTISFDTIVSGQESITLRFRAFNPHSQALKVEAIQLENIESPYTLTINGITAKNFSNVAIIGGDSLMVLVKANLPPQNSDTAYLVTDAVTFSYNDQKEFVRIVSWGVDASSITRETLPCHTVWKAGKPYLVNDFVLVDSLCTLTIEKGAQVLMGNDAAIFVKGTLHIMGTADDPVIIRNIRSDGTFAQAPGQWDAIYFLEGSKANTIDHALIKNGGIGLRVGTPDEDDEHDITISHTIIQNMSVAGILAFTSDIYAYNVQVNNCRNYLVGNFIGGNYTYEHCTFSNFPNDFFRQEPSVQFSDVLFVEGSQPLVAPLSIRMINSIVWGNEREEFLISNAGGQQVILDLQSNIMRSQNNRWSVLGNVISQDRNFPRFIAPLAANFQIDSLSPARDKGQPIGIQYDLNKKQRDELPDIGAFEWVNGDN